MTTTVTITIPVNEITAGMLIARFPYAGPETCPVYVRRVVQSMKAGYLIVEGVDAQGRYVLVPCGHKSGTVEIQEVV